MVAPPFRAGGISLSLMNTQAVALFMAADGGDDAQLRLMLQGDNVADLLLVRNLLKGTDGWTVLHCAAHAASPACVQVLLEAADLCGVAEELRRSKSVEGLTPLMAACAVASLGGMQLLLSPSNIRDQVMARTQNRSTPLMLAAGAPGSTNVECVRFLLETFNPRAQLLAANEDGMSALMYAALHGRVEVMRLLLDSTYGCAEEQLRAVDTNGGNALTFAASGLSMDHPEALQVNKDSVAAGMQLLLDLMSNDSRKLTAASQYRINWALREVAIRFTSNPSAALKACIAKLVRMGASMPKDVPGFTAAFMSFRG
jgi:ankyrin repeat protein